MSKQHIERTRELMETADIDAVIVQDPASRRWLSDYNSVYQRAYVLVTRDTAHIVTYSYGVEQARMEAPGVEVLSTGGQGAVAVVAQVLKKAGANVLGFDTDVAAAVVLPLQDRGFALKPVRGILGRARAVKTGAELERFRAAGQLHDRALEYVEGVLQAGRTEAELRAQLDGFLLQNGAEAFTFETVILAGERAAFPHLRPSARALGRGDLVTVDFGAVMDGADCDVCRTYVVGEPTREMVSDYAAVREAQEAAIAACVPGTTGVEVYEAARAVLETKGLAELFTHGLGHGLSGGPTLAPRSQDVLVPGAIVAVEPGIYRPGWGGMRVEDTVLVTDHGPEKLTGFGGDELIIV